MFDLEYLQRTLGLSQAEIAARIGVSVMTLNRWQRGVHHPHLVFERKIKELEKEAAQISNK